MASDILTLLKNNKIKITSERTAIIAVLDKATLPLSPAAIFRQVKTHLPKTNLSTVYRNLEMLEKLNLIRRVSLDPTTFSYEVIHNRTHHHHVVCRKCVKVEELDTISEKFIQEVTKNTDFKIENHNLEFIGLCKDCQKEVR